MHTVVKQLGLLGLMAGLGFISPSGLSAQCLVCDDDDPLKCNIESSGWYGCTSIGLFGGIYCYSNPDFPCGEGGGMHALSMSGQIVVSVPAGLALASREALLSHGLIVDAESGALRRSCDGALVLARREAMAAGVEVSRQGPATIVLR